jgi:putative alkyl hydroperoxide reductase F subunit
MSNIYDLIIVGAGPAGLTAAIYMARAKYSVLIIEKDRIGGQIAITEEVVNYPGINITSGRKLTNTMKSQAETFGTDILMADVTNLNLNDTIKEVVTSRGTFQGLTVLLSTGANPRRLGFIGETEFQGKGVAYCATCDGEFFVDKDIFVIGGGFAAAEEAIFLTKYGKNINIIVRDSKFSCPKSISDDIMKHPKISVHFNTELKEVGGEFELNFAKFVNNKTGETWKYAVDKGDTFGVFVLAGRFPANELAENKIDINENGYIITDVTQKTNIDGVYAAGDICVKELRQVVTAVSDGAIAATSIEKYVSQIHSEHNVETKKNLAKSIHLNNSKKNVKGKKNANNKKNLLDKNLNNEDDTYSENDVFISPDMIYQLKTLFDKFEEKVTLKLLLNESRICKEIERFAKEISDISENINYEVFSDESNDNAIQIWKNGEYSGLAFHGVPGGHEFNSFVIALYNVAGEGQVVEDIVRAKINTIIKPINIKIMVSLSCTMCPELVMAAQRIASLNPLVSAEVFDIKHFAEYKEKYRIMSIPCIIINDLTVVFGKRNIKELIDILVRFGA